MAVNHELDRVKTLAVWEACDVVAGDNLPWSVGNLVWLQQT